MQLVYFRLSQGCSMKDLPKLIVTSHTTVSTQGGENGIYGRVPEGQCTACFTMQLEKNCTANDAVFCAPRPTFHTFFHNP